VCRTWIYLDLTPVWDFHSCTRAILLSSSHSFAQLLSGLIHNAGGLLLHLKRSAIRQGFHAFFFVRWIDAFWRNNDALLTLWMAALPLCPPPSR